MAAKVTGVQHVAIAVSDMREALGLYRDILGMEIKAANGPVDFDSTGLIAKPATWPTRMYNLDMGSGAVLTLVEIPGAPIEGRKSGFAVELWPDGEAPGPLGGIDHIGMNVDTEADLIELHEKLKAANYRVSDLQRVEINPWWKQFFFYDRDGNAMEITTWDWSDPAWTERRRYLEGEGRDLLFNDPDPLW